MGYFWGNKPTKKHKLKNKVMEMKKPTRKNPYCIPQEKSTNLKIMYIFLLNYNKKESLKFYYLFI